MNESFAPRAGNKLRLIFLIISIIVGFLLFVTTLEAEAPTEKLSEPTATELVAFYFGKDADTMLKIAKCESHVEQFNKDGSIKRGIVDPRDTGVFQINTYYHLEESKKLGFDIFTTSGNVQYAKYLFDKNGTRDWTASRHCWGA